MLYAVRIKDERGRMKAEGFLQFGALRLYVSSFRVHPSSFQKSGDTNGCIT